MTFTDEQQQIIADAMNDGGIPGMSVALVQGGETVAAGGFGQRDREQQLPMNADTVQSIASITKSFTAMAIMMLVEEGRIALDEPVQTYLPEFRVADEVATRKITPRMLLSHKSGMGRTGHQTPVFTEPVSPYSDKADLVSRLKDVELQSPPNAAWSYCNEGYVTLGLLIEKLSETPLAEFYEQRIFQPLGLSDTHAGFATWKQSDNGTTGYKKAPDGLATAWLPDEYDIYLSTGGIVSTAPDLARYIISSMEYTHHPLVSAGSLEQMHSISMPYGDTGWGYGLGWFIRWHNGQKVVAHSGGQAGVATYALMVPGQRAGVTVISNLSGAKVANIAEQLAGTLLGKPLFRASSGDRLPIQTRYAQPGTEERAAYTGTFTFAPATLTIIDDSRELVAQAFSPEEPDAEPTGLLRVGDDRFLTVQDGSPITFLRNAAGDIDRLLAGGNLYLKAS